MGRLHGRKHRGAPAKVRDPAITKTEENFYKCPKGHRLPSRTEHGECTPIYCAAQGNATRRKTNERIRDVVKKVKEKIKNDTSTVNEIVKGDGDAASLTREVAREAQLDESVRVGKAAGRFAARHTLMDVPPNLEGAAAEAWADQKIVKLLPLAVAETEFQLKYGDDAQRRDAANRVMDATGRGKRGDNGGGAPTIVLVGTGEGGKLNFPWVRKPKEIAEGEVVDAQKQS